MEKPNKNEKIKTITDFSDNDTASIKVIAIKKNDKVKITTRFIKGKMLMFSKVSIRSFVYDLIDIFSFPDNEITEIYARHDLIKCFIYLILTDTDSCSIQFLFLTDLKSHITENESRKLIFEIILLKVGQRIDTSDDFYAQFLCQNKKNKKKVRLYEVESIDNTKIFTIALNPKEYFEVFRNKAINKKHKGVKKSTPWLNFEAFASRIMYLKEYSYAEKLPRTIKQKRFQIKNTSMQMKTVTRKQFAGLNDKRFYFTVSITSLPFGHLFLTEIKEHKKQYKKIHKDILKIKDYLIREEHNASSECERVGILRSI